ncbi:MAG: AAA family ATPase, partial [Planktomarina sp.]
MDNSHDPNPSIALQACMVAREPQAFALLIEDIDDVIGQEWGELNHAEAHMFLSQQEAKFMDCIIVAVDEDDRDNLPAVEAVLHRAQTIGVPALLVAEDLTASELHQLIQAGARDFIPYPLPKGALASAYTKIQDTVGAPAPAPEKPVNPASIFVVQGLCGGCGATSLAVTLADEMAQLDAGKTCLLDLDLQFGSVGGHLNMRPRETVLDLLTNLDVIDADGFKQALQVTDAGLHVLTAPNEVIPLDLLDNNGISRLIDLASAEFDFVIIDMPKAVLAWSEVVLNNAAMVFCPLELDIRSAQAAAKYRAILSAEGLATDTLRFALNRSPKFTDLTGKSRVKKLAEALNTTIDIMLPDIGKTMTQTADQGLSLSVTYPKSTY